MSKPRAITQPYISYKRKVSFVLHKFDRGGSPRVAAYLARGFADQGMDVDIIVFTRRGEVDDIIGSILENKVPVHYLGSWNGPRPLDLIRGLPALVRQLRARSPDTVIAAANNIALVTSVAFVRADLEGRQLFIKTTNPIATSRHRGLIKAIRWSTYKRAFAVATGVWTLSSQESDEMRAAFPEFAGLFREVVNPYVTAEMLAGATESDGVADERYILGVGRLTEQKRFERLIEAFALVRDKTVHLKILRRGRKAR